MFQRWRAASNFSSRLSWSGVAVGATAVGVGRSLAGVGVGVGVAISVVGVAVGSDAGLSDPHAMATAIAALSMTSERVVIRDLRVFFNCRGPLLVRASGCVTKETPMCANLFHCRFIETVSGQCYAYPN